MTSQNWIDLAWSIEAGIEEVYHQWLNEPKSIITEGDLQGVLWQSFGNRISDFPGSSIHSQVPFLNEDGGLRWYPDIVIFDNEKLSLAKSAELYRRKGSTYYGECIALELKLNRIQHVHTFREEWKRDIDKLAAIRGVHYEHEQFIGIFVLFSHEPIPPNITHLADEYASDRGIKVICKDRLDS